jgi:hypothetical protein
VDCPHDIHRQWPVEPAREFTNPRLHQDRGNTAYRDAGPGVGRAVEDLCLSTNHKRARRRRHRCASARSPRADADTNVMRVARGLVRHSFASVSWEPRGRCGGTARSTTTPLGDESYQVRASGCASRPWAGRRRRRCGRRETGVGPVAPPSHATYNSLRGRHSAAQTPRGQCRSKRVRPANRSRSCRVSRFAGRRPERSRRHETPPTGARFRTTKG